MEKGKSGTVKIDPKILKEVKRVIIDTGQSITLFIESSIIKELNRINSKKNKANGSTN